MTEHGGGPVWVTGTYDPDTNLTYWGTGNAAPWTQELRPGDNLYTSSVLALDASTGAIKGYHQYQWNEGWDWDVVSPPVLLDVKRDGRTVKSLVHAGRDGYLWILERTAGPIQFVDAWPFVAQNVFRSIDPKTGRPEYDPEHVMKIGKSVTYCPSAWGGKDWPPEAYSPRTGLFYVPAHNNLCSKMTQETPKYTKGELYIGVPLEAVLTNLSLPPEAKDHIGELQAWNLATKKRAWTHDFPEMLWGPLLATAGDVLFAGGTNDRKFRAFDATNGKVLWEYPASSGVTGIPTSFEIDGEQYVAVLSGWGVDAQRMQNAFDAVLDRKTVVPAGGTVLVFKLEKN
jgi:alcohol dehydrogenase (cytochrome c)